MQNTPVPRAGASSPIRFLPLLVLLAGFGAFFALGLHRYLSFATLQAHYATLRQWVQAHSLLAPLAYMGVYTLVVAFSLPGGAVLSITGGLLFGAFWGTLYIVVGATLGATILFLLARTALGEPLRARAGPWLHRLQRGFQENALNYLLVLRLVPLFPFWVVNLVPAFLGVRVSVYVLGTFVGIIPGTFVYASVGAGLGSVFAAGESFDPRAILTPQIVVALVGLAVLALIPVWYKKRKTRRSKARALQQISP